MFVKRRKGNENERKLYEIQHTIYTIYKINISIFFQYFLQCQQKICSLPNKNLIT
jgi:hypothetical protein